MRQIVILIVLVGILLLARRLMRRPTVHESALTSSAERIAFMLNRGDVPAAVRWYSVDKDLELQDRETIDVDRALAIVDAHFERFEPAPRHAEAALAATMYGFVRDDGSFMEICLHGYEAIDVRYEEGDGASGVEDATERLGSRDAVRRRVRQFFGAEPREVR